MTLSAALMVTWQSSSFLPVHAPLHSSNFHPLAGIACNRIFVPEAKVAMQLGPQSIPSPGELFTLPSPILLTDKVKSGVTKVALTVVVLAVMWTTQVLVVPLQPPPLQPEKMDPLMAEAVRVIDELNANGAAQGWIAVQSSPVGLLVTTPMPFTETVKFTGAKVPIALLPESVNQIEPLGPIVIPCAEALDPGMGYSVMAPPVVIWPIAVPAVNHKA